ncbi:MAG: lysophospholipid acyltransferase family protein [Rhodocyclaceae bacterium]|nr:lysophospholipid acyltransferase family protein [Rhodocyclaceae bacterium]
MSLLFRFLASLPLIWVQRLGAAAGWLVYGLSPRYRRRLRANLGIAMGSVPRSLLRAAVAEAGKQALEFPWILLRAQQEVVDKVVDVQGWEVVEDARAAGQGILYLTPHLGCFEITAQYCSRSAPITVLYRPPRQAALGPLIRHGRERGQIRMAPADMGGVRRLIQSLRKGEAVGMLPDQAPSVGEGRWIPFFGRPAWTMTLAARLSEVQGVQVVLVWAQRLPGGAGYCFRLAPPDPPLEGDLEARMLRINQEMERLIRACPAQYLWGYNRYKRPAGVPPPDAPAA